MRVFAAALAALSFAACKTAAPEKKPDTAAPQATAAAAGGSCTGLDPKTVVATIDGAAITAADLDKEVGGKVKQEESDFLQKVYEMRRGALEGEIAKHLVEGEAKAKSIAPEMWMEAQVTVRAKDPSDEDVKKYFDAHPDQMQGRPFDQIKDPLKKYLGNEKKRDAMMGIIDELKKAHKVVVNLPAPAIPRVEVAATGPVRGPGSAPVTIIEFSDFQCPFCGKEIPVVEQVMKQYDGKVKLFFRHFPLSFHEHAQKAAEAAACARELGGDEKFWALHDKMFTDQQHLEIADLKSKAKDVGLDAGKFGACLDSGKEAEAVKADQKAGEAAGVNGTPAFFVNGQLISGAQPLDRFKEAIDRELKRD